MVFSFVFLFFRSRFHYLCFLVLYSPNHCVLVGISVVVLNTDQKQLEKEKCLFQLRLPHHSPSPKEIRIRTQGRKLEAELMQRPWKTVYCLLLMVCSVSFLTPCRAICPGMALFPVSWAHPQQWLFQKFTTDFPIGKSFGDVFSVDTKVDSTNW